MTQILVVNHFGTNKGDAAILVGLTKALKTSVPDAQLSVISSAPDIDRKYFGESELSLLGRVFRLRSQTKEGLALWLFRALLWVAQSTLSAALIGIGPTVLLCTDPRKRQILRAYSGADVVVSCGGGYLTDNSGLAILAPLHEIVLGMIARKPVFLCAQSIGPYRKTKWKLLTRFILDRAQLITLREPESHRIVASMGLHRVASYVTADAAFLLDPVAQDRASEILRHERIEPGNHLVGITLHSWHYPGSTNPDDKHLHYKRVMAETADYLVSSSDLTPVFVPMNITGDFWDERPLAAEVIGLMQHGDRAKIIQGDYTPAEVAAVIAHMNYVIGTRFHSVILAFLSGVPAVAIMYEPKARGVMNMMNLDMLVCDINSLDTADLVGRIEYLQDNLEQIRKTLEERRTVLRKLASLNGRFVSALLEHTKTRRRPPLATIHDSFNPEEIWLLQRFNQLPL